jgi:hypothetical protein
MAAPNIVNVANIYAKSTALIPSVTTAVVLLQNAVASGKVIKINTIIASNIDGTNAISTTVSYYTNGSVAQGSAPSGGSAFPIVFSLSVPAGATLNVLDKSTAIYLEEGTSVTVTSGTSSKISYLLSYEEIS